MIRFTGCIHLIITFIILLILFIDCDIKVPGIKKSGRLQEFMNWAGPPRPSSQKPLDGVWQPVAHTRHPFYVYSAFVDRRRQNPAVVVIGVTKRIRIWPSMFCRLWMPSSRTTYILVADIKYTKNYDNWQNNSAFVLCLLNTLYPKDIVGGSISVVSQSMPERLATNLLKILDISPKNRNSSKPNVHICVRPLHNSFDNVAMMVEWIELNRLLGVSHFYFYNMSIGANVDCMLSNYQHREELFTILPFQSPVENFWNEGQLSSNQDCLYRSMPRADWLMVIDLDEMVLPHSEGVRVMQLNKDTNSSLFAALFELIVRQYYLKNESFALLFRNAFFYQGFEDDLESPVPLLTSRKTKRLDFVNWYGVRSKYAVQPSQAIELGIYKVMEFVSDANSLDVRVGSDVALLHHYRRECIQFKCTEGYPTTVDRSAQFWAEPLWKRVQERLNELDRACIQNPDFDTII